MLGKFRHRNYELEHIDSGDYTPEEYEGCIAELQLVNSWLGDAWTLRRTLLKHVSETELKCFSVLDVGAGSGQLLRVTAHWARSADRKFSGVGIELNERSAEAIKEESASVCEIESVRGDARFLPFGDGAFDFVICSLFTHHFVELEVINILREMSRVARQKLFVIDLHRHPVAYYLYTTVGKLILHNRLLREDGALSILRGFKRRELRELAQIAGLKDVTVSRHFPFRLVLIANSQRLKVTERPIRGAERAA